MNEDKDLQKNVFGKFMMRMKTIILVKKLKIYNLWKKLVRIDEHIETIYELTQVGYVGSAHDVPDSMVKRQNTDTRKNTEIP